LHENPQFLSAKGTTKKAEALELFVYSVVLMRSRAVGIDKQKIGSAFMIQFSSLCVVEHF
jgi:hypothetical protein